MTPRTYLYRIRTPLGNYYSNDKNCPRLALQFVHTVKAIWAENSQSDKPETQVFFPEDMEVIVEEVQ